MRARRTFPVLCVLVALGAAPGVAAAAAILIAPGGSPLTGAIEELPDPDNDFFPTQATFAPYDTTGNLAFQGNGAAAAVASGAISPQDPLGAIHRPEFANDGRYGNGASWIGNQGDNPAWLKIDLGSPVLIDRVSFGRDRLGIFNDRDPGQFFVELALSDDVYATGNDQNDAVEYTRVVDSAALGFGGVIDGPETVVATFDAALARYVRLQFSSNATAIDEVEVFAAAVDAPAGAALALPGLLLVVAVRGRDRRAHVGARAAA